MLDVRCPMLGGGKEAFLRANVESSIAAGRLQLAQQSGGGILCVDVRILMLRSRESSAQALVC
ncbi:MAG: hypothetical protein QOH96_3588 [Blastocatellia bacterium]|jgi:hypothetical protein|nr:hypothetical protein [Blastocatellia bacterium]